MASAPRRHNPPGVSSQPTFAVSLPDVVRGNEYAGVRHPLLPIRYPGGQSQQQQQQRPWAGEAARWSGVDILTHYPGGSDGALPAEAWRSLWAASLSSSSSAVPRLEGLPDCDDDCTRHSETVHDALRLLKARHLIPYRFMEPWDPENLEDFMAWLRAITWTTRDVQGMGHGNLHQMNGPAQELSHLPVPTTRLNAELIRLCTFCRSCTFVA